MSGDLSALLVDRLSRACWQRHDPGVVAQVTLRFWSRHRTEYTGLGDPRLEKEIAAVLARMPSSRQPSPPPTVAGAGSVPRYGGAGAARTHGGATATAAAAVAVARAAGVGIGSKH